MIFRESSSERLKPSEVMLPLPARLTPEAPAAKSECRTATPPKWLKIPPAVSDGAALPAKVVCRMAAAPNSKKMPPPCPEPEFVDRLEENVEFTIEYELRSA